MGYGFCNADSAIATCDSYNWPAKPRLRRRNNHHYNHQTKNPIELRRFTYVELEEATDGFSQSTLLGKGSHGAVYRAILDNRSLVVAVKRPTTTSTLVAENEIEILSRIVNRRVVNLVGYAVAEPGKLLLVVEYMPNGSLYDLIHTNPKPPSWRTRVRTAMHIAKAVRTLHGSNPPVMHRDIKSSNILIDSKGNARLSDFGLALRGHVEDPRVMSTPPAGTLGYLDPCYLSPGDVSTKCDVFSFGILMLEIISGRRAIDVNYSPPFIVEWALPLIKTGNYHAICDRRMGCIADQRVIMELAILAARCVRSTAEKRPCASEVVECLKMVYKRVQVMQVVPMWSSIRRRVRRVEISQPLDDDLDGSDWEDQRVKTSRHGSRRSLSGRSGRKVSSVPTPREGVVDRVGDDVTRVAHQRGRSISKSVGSFREISSGNNNATSVVKKRAQVTVKMSSVRLSKSRSMSSVLQQSSKNNVRNPQLKEVDEFPLLVHSKSESPK